MQVEAWACDRCGHVWYQHGKQPPPMCSKCRSRAWDGRTPMRHSVIPKVRKPRAAKVAKARPKAEPKPVQVKAVPVPEVEQAKAVLAELVQDPAHALAVAELDRYTRPAFRGSFFKEGKK